MRYGMASRTDWATGLDRPWLRDLLSFEALFACCLYSNVYKIFVPGLPVDETVLLALPTIPLAIAIIARRGLYLAPMGALLGYLLLAIWITASATWTPSTKMAAVYLNYFWSIDLWFFIVGAFVIAPERERLIRLLQAIFVLSVILAVIGVYIYLAYGTFRFYEPFAGQGRIYNKWGYAVAPGAVVAFVVATQARFGRRRQLVYGAGFAVCTFFLLIATSRGALLGAGVACLLALVLRTPALSRRDFRLSRSQVVTLAMLLAGFAAGAYWLTSGGKLDTFGRFERLLQEASNPDMVQGPNRFAYYAAAMRFWFEAPVLGNGAASFSHMFYGREVMGGQPHNIVLELLCDYGLVGLALFTVFTATSLLRVTRARLREDPLLLCIFLLFVTYLTGAMYGEELSLQHEMMLGLGLLFMRDPLARRGEALARPRGSMLFGMRRRLSPRPVLPLGAGR